MTAITSQAVRIDQHGGPEELKLVEVQVGEPGPGQIRIRHKAIGLNFIDVYQRSGLYPSPMPLQLGMEASGIVEAVGEGVTHLQPGDRAAYASQPPGSYCEVRVMPAQCVCKLPDAISFETGAAMLLKGLTAQYLLRRTYRVQPGDTLLIHAAAGGVGTIACQWAKALGATVIGTVSSEEKAAIARAHGCDYPIIYTRENFVERVREITGGEGGGGNTGEQTYTVEKGDNLSTIAKQFYGRQDWKRIYDANRDQLDDPDRIKPGQVLRIPPADPAPPTAA